MLAYCSRLCAPERIAEAVEASFARVFVGHPDDDRSLDARADIYALGAIAYYAVTGRPPFSGETPMALMIAHARDPVVPPSQVRADVPADLESIILRCLAKKPGERYPDSDRLDRDLAACRCAGDWDRTQAAAWWQRGGEVAQKRAG